MSTYNIGFNGEISKITSKLSSNTHFICSSVLTVKLSPTVPSNVLARLTSLNLSSAHRVCPVSLVEGYVSKGTLNQNEQNSESLG